MWVGETRCGRLGAGASCHVLEEAAVRGVDVAAQLLLLAQLRLDLLVNHEVNDSFRNAVIRRNDAAVEAAYAVLAPGILHTARDRQTARETAAKGNKHILNTCKQQL